MLRTSLIALPLLFLGCSSTTRQANPSREVTAYAIGQSVCLRLDECDDTAFKEKYPQGVEQCYAAQYAFAMTQGKGESGCSAETLQQCQRDVATELCLAVQLAVPPTSCNGC